MSKKDRLRLRYILNLLGAELFLFLVGLICHVMQYDQLRIWIPAVLAGALLLIAHALVRRRQTRRMIDRSEIPTESEIIWFATRIIYRINFGALVAGAVVVDLVPIGRAWMSVAGVWTFLSAYYVAITLLQMRDLPYDPEPD